MNIGKDTASSNGDISQELVELLIVLDGKSNVTRNDAAFLVVTSGIASKFENLSTKVLEDGSKVDGSSSSHTGAVLSLTEITSNTTDGELKTSFSRRTDTLPGRASTASLSFSFSCVKQTFAMC